MIRHATRREEDLQLNMTPMIDMVFLLIIFFLTATTFTQKERELDVQLPATRVAGSLSKALERNLILNVRRDGTVAISGRTYGEEELVAYVRDLSERSKGTLKVKVRGDARALWAHVARVFAAVNRAGVKSTHVDYKQVELES
ncbi:MAG: biopolymer transporter ExbD [Planctomycetes bacterium]|nr:biopolymer transporter ExbD [Planctomycetota bacterium]